MTTKKEQLLNYITVLDNDFKEALDIVPSLLSNVKDRFESSKEETYQMVKQGELFVPIIGGFSAGKSTMINSFMGRDILPAAVTAETAIPAELRYSGEEYILAYRTNGIEERHSISNLPVLSQQASNYEVVKIFVNSPVIKNIEPFILVDMPGFDSSLEQHNNAILRYLNRGCFYFYLVSCLDGAIHSQGLQRLQEVNEMDREFAILITKKDLQPCDQTNCVETFIRDQIEQNFSTNIEIDLIDMNDVNPLVKILSKINADYLFNKQFINIVKELYYMASGHINSAITALNTSKDEGRSNIEKLIQLLSSIERERDKGIRSIQSGKILEAKNKIAKRLENDLNSAVNQLVPFAKSGSDSLNRAISDLVRNSLVSELKKVTGQISLDVVHNLTHSIAFNVETNLNISEDWINNLMDVLQSEVMTLLIDHFSSSNLQNKKSNTASDVVGSVFSGVAALIPHPVVKIILGILPGIIGQLFSSAKESRNQERYAQAIREEIIPEVMLKIKPQIEQSLEQISSFLINAVSDQFEVKINDQKSVLENAQDKWNIEQESADMKINKLQLIIGNINELTGNTII